jgi:hypothetical protein
MRGFDARLAGLLAAIEQVLHSPRAATGKLALGRALLLVCGMIVASSIWSLHPTASATPVLAATSLVLLGVVALSGRLPLTDEASRRPLIFPLAVPAGLTAIGLADNGGASAYTGLIVLCFVYVGLTQRPWTSLFFCPAAAGTWLACQDAWSGVLAIRLSIAIVVWLVVGGLLEFRSDRAARDRLLLFGQAQTDSLTGQDAAGRYGGEEFLLVLADTSPEAAIDVMSRMRNRWSRIHPQVTFSSGIAAVTESGPTRVALASADDALYTSKRAGRNCDHISYQQIVRVSTDIR